MFLFDQNVRPDKEEYLWLLNQMLLLNYSAGAGADQVFLNRVYPDEEKLYLDERWNANQLILRNHFKKWKSFEKDIAIYHFVGGYGSPKPWNDWCRRPFLKYCQIWRKQEETYYMDLNTIQN